MRARNEERIYHAKRAGVVARYAVAHEADRAEAAVAAWEDEAGRIGLARGGPEFWQRAEPWIEAELASRR